MPDTNTTNPLFPGRVLLEIAVDSPEEAALAWRAGADRIELVADLATQGLSASATMIGTSLHTLVQMVDNGLGVTMLPQMAIDAGILHETEVVARPLKGKAASREIALLWRKNSPRAEEFRLLAEELRAG